MYLFFLQPCHPARLSGPKSLLLKCRRVRFGQRGRTVAGTIGKACLRASCWAHLGTPESARRTSFHFISCILLRSSQIVQKPFVSQKRKYVKRGNGVWALPSVAASRRQGAAFWGGPRGPALWDHTRTAPWTEGKPEGERALSCPRGGCRGHRDAVQINATKSLLESTRGTVRL